MEVDVDVEVEVDVVQKPPIQKVGGGGVSYRAKETLGVWGCMLLQAGKEQKSTESRGGKKPHQPDGEIQVTGDRSHFTRHIFHTTHQAS